MSTTTAYISLGSNIEPREEHLQLAIDRLHRVDCRVTAVSLVYETEAVGVEGEHPNYLNAAVQVQTEMNADRLLEHLLYMEQLGGRERVYYGNPRTIDLDLILYGNMIISSPPRLIVPHPRAHERAFVMRPMLDICPELLWPDGTSLISTCQRSPAVDQHCILYPYFALHVSSGYGHCDESDH